MGVLLFEVGTNQRRMEAQPPIKEFDSTPTVEVSVCYR